MCDVTQILSRLDSGDAFASEELLPLIYDELRKLAAARLSQERSDQTIQATALVHEAYLRLVGPNQQGRCWDNRGHFFAAAAEAMRRILIDNARRKGRVRHGGAFNRVDLDSQLEVTDDPDTNVLALDEALRQLENEEPEAAKVVKLRYFASLTIEETALAMGLSVRTVNRHWAFARAWLYERLN